MQHVFIVGSKGIPGAYGGYETFVDKLTEYHQNKKELKYHVACKNMSTDENDYHNARCFNVKVPNIGPAQAIYYDVKALSQCVKYIKKLKIENPIVYILACRISIFGKLYQRKVNKLGGKLFINPDGHEWKRQKWNKLIRKYWKFSEKEMIKHADLVICDSKNIEKYVKEEYGVYSPNTTFVAYGAEPVVNASNEDIASYEKWLKSKKLVAGEYYLVVGRFVPENNYEVMIREFMASKTDKRLAIITTDNDKYYEYLDKKLSFSKDERISFVGTVYDKAVLQLIRQNAYGYLHGHEVGGTNPSLLEALATTKLNLLLDVGFNQEVGEQAALYWSKNEGELAKLIDKADKLDSDSYQTFGRLAKERIENSYSWQFIADEYEGIFL